MDVLAWCVVLHHACIVGTSDVIFAIGDVGEDAPSIQELPPRKLAARALVIIELKKGNITEQNRYQAQAQLISADLAGELCCPVSVLTNLGNYWEVFWIQELKIYSCKLKGM